MHFHAAITPHPSPPGAGGESPRPYLALYCNDDPIMRGHSRRVSSKDAAAGPRISKTKGAAFGIEGFCSLAARPPLLALIASMCVVLTGGGGNGIKRDGEDGRNKHPDLGKVAHRSVCPADTTNSPCLCVRRRRPLKKKAP